MKAKSHKRYKRNVEENTPVVSPLRLVIDPNLSKKEDDLNIERDVPKPRSGRV